MTWLCRMVPGTVWLLPHGFIGRCFVWFLGAVAGRYGVALAAGRHASWWLPSHACRTMGRDGSDP